MPAIVPNFWKKKKNTNSITRSLRNIDHTCITKDTLYAIAQSILYFRIVRKLFIIFLPYSINISLSTIDDQSFFCIIEYQKTQSYEYGDPYYLYSQILKKGRHTKIAE